MNQNATWYEGIDLGPCHIVLDGDQAPPERGTTAPSFWIMPIMATIAHPSYW